MTSPNAAGAAVAEERWGDLVQRIAGLEDDLVHDKKLRWTWSEKHDDFKAAPIEAGRWHIPADIDPGGPLL